MEPSLENGIVYREAISSDAEELLRYQSRVGGETDYLSYGENTFNISVEREARFIDRFYKNKGEIMLVALSGDRIVGNGVIERERIERYSHRATVTLTVLRDFWGMGIGSELMRRMIEFSRNAGISVLSLEVRSDNDRAISLYRRFGFVDVGCFKSFFKIKNKYYDACLMQLCL